jgi:hypothetical protein
MCKLMHDCMQANNELLVTRTAIVALHLHVMLVE